MSPEEMEKLPKPLERIMNALEMSVMEEVIERIKHSTLITPVIDWQLNRLQAIGVSKQHIKERIAATLKETDLQIDEIYQQATKSDYVRHKELYEAAGRDYLPYSDNPWLQQVVGAARRQTKDSMRPFENLTQTTGFNIKMGKKRVFTPLSEYLERSLDKAMLGITTGTHTYSKAINEVIQEMTNSGLRVVDYASGKSDRIEVAARRAVMTGVAQMVDKVNEHNAEELKTEHWEVDWHMGARNTGIGYLNHQDWQGRVYDNKGMREICGLGKMLGFAGINCYHIRFPFIPGINKRKYTDEWLEEQNRKENQKRIFKGQEYDTYGALQHQRKLERTIRKQNQDIRLLEKAGADKDDIIAAKSRKRLTEKTYVDFSKEMGLRQQRERLTIPKDAIASRSKPDIIKAIEIAKDITQARGITTETATSIKAGIDEIEKEYQVNLNRVKVEDISVNYPDTPYLTRYSDNHGAHEVELIINKGYDFSGFEDVVKRGYEYGYFAGKTVKDHAVHEMVHVMTGQQYKTAAGFNTFADLIEKQYVPSVSGYSDAMQNGFETIAEAFVRMRNNEPVPDEARKLVEKYIERWRK